MVAQSSVERLEAIIPRLEAARQSHLLCFWPTLGERSRHLLLAELEEIALESLPDLVARCVLGDSASSLPAAEQLEPVVPERLAEAGPAALDAGEQELSQGAVAAVTVAGGQATRLGFDGPKGIFPVGPVTGHGSFHLFAEQLLATGKRYGRAVPWYVMTSASNHCATVAWFEAHGLLGLAPDQVRFFVQGRMPCFGLDGRILLEERGRVAFAPDGHGGIFGALERSGMLREMSERGVHHLSCFQVDNPLVRCLDPRFIGMHALAGAELSSKSLAKAHDREGLGTFCRHRGRLTVVEYSELPESMATARGSDGHRRYDAGSISVYVIERRFAERMVDAGLPWHRARKRVGHLDCATGRRVEPSEPNAVKLERFLFDAASQAQGWLVVETSRDEEFAPVKNLAGADSVQTSRGALVRRACRWLREAGVEVPVGEDGEPAAVVEISAWVAQEARELRGSVPGGLRIAPGSCVYLGPDGVHAVER